METRNDTRQKTGYLNRVWTPCASPIYASTVLIADSRIMPVAPSELWPAAQVIASIAAVFAGVFKIFAFVEDQASPELKMRVSERLQSPTPAVSLELRSFHRTLFGEKQFSLRCVISIALCSTFSTILNYTVISILLRLDIFVAAQFLDFLFYIGFALATIIFPSDFIGVYITRVLLRSNFTTRTGGWVGLLFLVDCALKYLVFLMVATIATELSYSSPHVPIVEEFTRVARDSICYHNMFLCALVMYNLFATLLSSSWVWLFAVSAVILSRLRTIFDVQNKPLRSIGVVAASICALIYAGLLLGAGVTSQKAKSETSEMQMPQNGT